MQAERRTITQDHYEVVCWLAELGKIAFGAADPKLSYNLLYAAVLVSIAEPIPLPYLDTVDAAAVDPECSGPARRCYGFLAAAVKHLGMVDVEPDPDVTLPQPAPPRQLNLFSGGSK